MEAVAFSFKYVDMNEPGYVCMVWAKIPVYLIIELLGVNACEIALSSSWLHFPSTLHFELEVILSQRADFPSKPAFLWKSSC